MENKANVRDRQEPLMIRYAENPKEAWITDVALIEGKDLDDPFHTTVMINEELVKPFAIGVHRAVGGLHDDPNPGDMLCASLASCFDTTLRMIANRLQIPLKYTKVKATAQVDVRGTLMVDREVPVNFQKMGIEVEVKVAESVSDERVEKLLRGAEKCCIVYQTIKKGIPVEVKTTIIPPDEDRKAA